LQGLSCLLLCATVDQFASSVRSANASIKLNFGHQFEFLALKIDRDALISKPRALTDSPVGDRLEFSGYTDFRQPAAASLRRLSRTM
jgi:hypothetical protein